jgi:hypothetical protein
MTKANTFLVLALALLAVGGALELRLHKSPTGVASTPAAKSLNVAVPSTRLVEPVNGKSMVRKSIEASIPSPTNADAKAPAATQIVDEEKPIIDRDFAAAAARPYVEAYQQQHPTLIARISAWDQYQAISISVPNGSNATGYLGVFFPTSDGANTGFACFWMDGNADHLKPISWGFGAKIADVIANFRRTPAEGNGCYHILP